MATTFLGSTWTTAAGNKTVTATPAVGDLIVVVCGNSGRTTAQAPTITDNNSSGTYTQVKSATKNTSADSLWVFVRTATIASASSTVFTMTQSSDSGGGLAVFSVDNALGTGSSAVYANGSQDNQAAGTPSLTLNRAPKTVDAIIGAVMTGSNSNNNTANPTDFSETSDQGYNNPATGLETVTRDSGHSSTTVAWTATTATGFASIAVAINRTVSASFTADAIIGTTVSASFTADAIVFATVSASFTANAVILKTQEASFTEDAVIFKTQAASFTADAIIGVIIENDTFTRSVGSGLGTSSFGFEYRRRLATAAGGTSVDGSIATKTGVGGDDFYGSPLVKYGTVQFDFYTGDLSANGLGPIVVPGWVTDAGSGLIYDNYLMVEDGDATHVRAFIDNTGLFNIAVDEDTWYTAKGLFTPDTALQNRIKIWKRGDPEPDWQANDDHSPSSEPNEFNCLVMYSPASIDNLKVVNFESAWNINGSFTTDAIRLKTQAASFTANAEIMPSFTADAVIDGGSTPTEDDFTADAVIDYCGRVHWTTPGDTEPISDTTPTYEFLVPITSGDLHFELQLDTVNTFDSGNLRTYRTWPDPSGWEYWDGDSWEPIPATGLSSSLTGSPARFTVPTGLAATTWYRRIRGAVI